MILPTIGAVYAGPGGNRRVKWLAPDTVCYQLMVRGKWAPAGHAVSAAAWFAWLGEEDEPPVSRPVPFVCSACGEESDAETPAEQRNHLATCRHRKETRVVESVVRHDAVLTCRSCGTRWGVRAPWPLDKRQRERGQLWMQRHTDSRQRACQGFWFDLQDLQEVRVG